MATRICITGFCNILRGILERVGKLCAHEYDGNMHETLIIEIKTWIKIYLTVETITCCLCPNDPEMTLKNYVYVDWSDEEKSREVKQSNYIHICEYQAAMT